MSSNLNVKKCLERYGLTSREVAGRLGVTPESFSLQIHGNPKLETIQRIADAVPCDITELFDTPRSQNILMQCPHCGNVVEVKMELVREEVKKDK